MHTVAARSRTLPQDCSILSACQQHNSSAKRVVLALQADPDPLAALAVVAPAAHTLLAALDALCAAMSSAQNGRSHERLRC